MAVRKLRRENPSDSAVTFGERKNSEEHEVEEDKAKLWVSFGG